MHDAVIISDLHLGSDNCQAGRICDFLERVRSGEIATNRLILNGDVFDSIDMRRLKKKHWKVLSLIRKLSDEIDVLWLCGNHDGPMEFISQLLGVTMKDEHVFESGGRRILIFHGHIFDEFLDKHPILTWVADRIYGLLQKIDRSHSLAKFAKRGSKTFLRCAKKIMNGAIEKARKMDCTAVCCGHTHQAIEMRDGDVHYFNSGCWTEKPCNWLTVTRGEIEVCTYQKPEVKADATEDLDSARVSGSWTRPSSGSFGSDSTTASS